MLKKLQAKGPVSQWITTTAMFALILGIISSIIVQSTKPSAAVEVVVLHEALEWAREVGYSAVSANCLDTQVDLYSPCSVQVIEKEEPFRLRCSKLTGTCELIQ